MKNAILVFLFLYSSQCISQEVESVTVDSKTLKKNTELVEKYSFPEKSLGVWEGVMKMYTLGTLRNSVKVRFTAAKTGTIGSYIWKTEYLSAKKTMVKDYKLVVDDISKGHYVLDEGDGVKLRVYNVENKIYSLFKVDDIYLTSSTELVGDQLIFEVTSGKEIDEIQGIKNYAFTYVQRVVMHKVD